MQFSVWPSYDRSWSETLSLAQWAQVNGFKSFWYADHLMSSVAEGESGDFRGESFRLTAAPFTPKPVNGTLPILVGTGSPRMLRLTALWAQEWNTWGDPDEVRRRTERFLTACDAVGREPGQLHRSAQALVFFTPTESARAEAQEHLVAGRSLIGGAQELVDQLARYIELGVDEFAIPDFTLGNSPEQRRDTYAALHSEVLSAFH